MRSRAAAALLMLAGFAVAPSMAQANINEPRKFAWSENAGWLNWRDANGGSSGVNVGASFLRGFIWGENIGWINTGNGAGPYLNANNTNFGVNILGSGYLSGYAWGENVGWINFGTQPALGNLQGARYDAAAQRFRGYAWAENLGWINLDDGVHFVSTAPVCCPGDADNSGSINFSDITSVLANFGTSVPGGNGPGDADCNGVVSFGDVTNVLANFGGTCP